MKQFIKSRKQKKVYPVVVEQDENGVYIGSVPTLKGCYTQGDSIEEVLYLLKTEVIPLCEEEMEDDIKPFMYLETRELEIEYA